MKENDLSEMIKIDILPPVFETALQCGLGAAINKILPKPLAKATSVLTFFFLELTLKGKMDGFYNLFTRESKPKYGETIADYLTTLAVFAVTPLIGPYAALFLHSANNYKERARKTMYSEDKEKWDCIPITMKIEAIAQAI